MDKITLNNNSFSNWREYIDYKFGNKELFTIEEFDMENKYFLSYRIRSINPEKKTEIIVQLEYPDFKEVFDIYFNHPNSPVLTKENETNSRGWDGQGSAFYFENLRETDEWLDESLYNGWTETTYYFDGKEAKTDLAWNGKSNIPIKQNYLERYGCVTFPIVPLVIWYKDWYWKRNPDRMKKIIPPMVDR